MGYIDRLVNLLNKENLKEERKIKAMRYLEKIQDAYDNTCRELEDKIDEEGFVNGYIKGFDDGEENIKKVVRKKIKEIKAVLKRRANRILNIDLDKLFKNFNLS